jgi:hypothetical protein
MVIAALALSLVSVAGCGDSGRKIVPVSGTVTFNGQPAKNVIVSFQPLSEKVDDNPGRGSSAYTDDNGHYVLIYDGEKPGALTGKHRVRISPQWVSKAADERGEGGGGPGSLNYPIPPEWNDLSKKEFEVPAGGTDKANFNIEFTPPSRRN